MPTTLPEGIQVPAGGDSYSLVPDLRKMVETMTTIVPVANTTARAAVVSALVAAGRGPSSSDPLYVDRQDAPSFARLERTHDGTNWAAVGAGSGVIVPLGGAGQVVGPSAESTLGIGTASENSGGWTVGGTTITATSRCLVNASCALNVTAGGDVVARHFTRIVSGGQAYTSSGYGDRALSTSGQFLLEAGATLHVTVYQASGSSRTYTGTLTAVARPVPAGW